MSASHFVKSSIANKATLFFLLVVFSQFFSFAGSTSSVASGLRGAGIGFTENKGQIADDQGSIRPDVLFTGDGGGTLLFIRETGISYVLKSDPIPEDASEDFYSREELNCYTHRVDVDFIGCNSFSTVIKMDEVEGYKNFYYPHCSNGITHVKSYNSLLQKNIYKNIDILYKGGKSEGLKYDIIINPGGRVDDVVMKYSGQDDLKIVNGNIVVTTSLGQLTEYMPKVYQEIEGKIKDVKARYEMTEEKKIVFKVDKYNENYPLLIDPWITYFGGLNNEFGASIATDANGNVIFVGKVNSVTNFPIQGAAQGILVAGYDSYVSKMDQAGSLVWSTYYGGSGLDEAYGVHADPTTNDIYFCGGTTSSNFPIGAAVGQTSFLNTYPGIRSAYLVKFTPAGTRLWSTFYGDITGVTYAADITTDANGDVVMVGTTGSNTNIATAATFRPAPVGGPNDFYVVKFRSIGTRIWGSYLGGTNSEIFGSISCDASNNIYIGGATASNDFPATAGAHQIFRAGGADAVLFKFNSLGQGVWGTFFGGVQTDAAYDVKVDNTGDVYIGGVTQSTTGISTPVSFQAAKNPGSTAASSDAFLAKFNSAGSILWATYLGGNTSINVISNAVDYITGIAIDSYNNVVVGGDTYSDDFPVTSCAYQTVFSGTEDQFITSFTPNGVMICSTYIGNGSSLSPHNESDIGGGTIAASGGFIHLIARTDNNYPVTPGCYQPVCGGDLDAAIVQLCLTSCGITKIIAGFSASKTILCKGEPVNFSIQNTSCSQVNTTYLWTFNGASTGSSTAMNPTAISYPSTGTYPVKVVITTPCGKDSVEKLTYLNVISCACIPTSSTITATTCSTYITPSGKTITGSGTYLDTIPNAAGCDSIITINVTINQATSYTITTTVCNSYTSPAGNIYTLNGIYNETIPNMAGCDSLLTINLIVNQSSHTTDSISVCYGESVVIHGQIQTVAGVYTQVFPAANGCDSTSTINFIVHQNPTASFTSAPNPTNLSNPTVYFTDHSVNASQWFWNFGDVHNSSSNAQHPNHTYADTGRYEVTLIVASEHGCMDTIQQPIIVKSDYIIYIPNTFTPNGDGINDLFLPKGTNLDIEDYAFYIFDRWGNLIFETNDTSRGWDGKANEGREIAQVDTYIWKISMKDNVGVNHKYLGHVTLLR